MKSAKPRPGSNSTLMLSSVNMSQFRLLVRKPVCTTRHAPLLSFLPSRPGPWSASHEAGAGSSRHFLPAPWHHRRFGAASPLRPAFLAAARARFFLLLGLPFGGGGPLAPSRRGLASSLRGASPAAFCAPGLACAFDAGLPPRAPRRVLSNGACTAGSGASALGFRFGGFASLRSSGLGLRRRGSGASFHSTGDVSPLP